MKRTKLLAIIVAVIVTLAGVFSACKVTPGDNSGANSGSEYQITLNTDKSFILEVGDVVDYTQYFIVKDKNGNRIMVTEDMLDLSRVDTSKIGSFTVTLTIGDSSKTALFNVKAKEGGSDTPVNPGELSAVLAKYADASKWNFAVTLSYYYDGDLQQDYYEYLGYNVLNSYEIEGYTYTDYLGYDIASDTYYFYYDNGNGTYDKFAEGSDDYLESLSYLYLIDLTALSDFTYTASGDGYKADNPSAAGNAIIYEYEGNYWTSLTIYVADGKLTKIVGVMDDGYSETYVLSKHGSVNFTLPNVEGGGNSDTPTTPTGTMEKQTYNPSTFDRGSLQDKMMNIEGAIGLPSTGDVKGLVIPVQFAGDTITQAQLDNLNIAFNGNSTDTGWESVSSYYQKASYGNLNFTFDIQTVYEAPKNSSYYASYSESYEEGGYTYTRTGEEVILKEVLAYYENQIDLTQYDNNDDGYIDAVYLIYSAPVDYDEAEFYWAYTTWYYGEETYDGVGAFYYFFAGFDFMDESTANDPGSGYGQIDGLKINAATYIHETGHLLGLDDYYDYDSSAGCNEGLGGADMMDYTVGDHNVYSKIMLGWLTPEIVNETTTVTIESSQSRASAILIPLNFNNSYFCEYLLIDLYSAQGLNALHASAEDSYLYDGASYGVRIYHVSSSINDPFNNDYGSFTDYNNTSTKIPLIKLVEADGDRKFASSGGLAAQSDLWKTGDTLSQVFPAYTRNDGKKVNFDITINSVSATSASITVTFN